MPERLQPNILITGSPGTGKSTTADLVASDAGLRVVVVGDIVREHELHDGFSNDHQAYYINEDKVNDYLEVVLAEGGVVLEHHSSDFFPERFFDLVVVLQTDNTVLYDRLAKRGYSEKKIRENVECEILRVPEDEAREAYAPHVVQCLQSNDTDDLEANVERIVTWARQFRIDHGGAQ